jgi:hypothetical protein
LVTGLIALSLALTLSACGLLPLGSEENGSAGNGAEAAVPTAGADTQARPGEQEWMEPWAQRPVVNLQFQVAPDLASVTGQEQVSFTPDRGICELVFRAWPNKPETAEQGNSLVVTEASVGGAAVEIRTQQAGAPTGAPPSLIELPLPACVEAGQTVQADLGFSLSLGRGADERVGYSGEAQMAWFATAFPLLAWERERGWAREDAVDVFGEMATSETFDLASLEVTAPAGFEVLGTGEFVEQRPGPGDANTSVFRTPTTRDVAVTVGQLEVVEREVEGVRMRVGGSATRTGAPLDRWADLNERALIELSDLLGPHPYRDLWITLVPGFGDGIEFPGAIYYGDGGNFDRASELVSHEVAHQWFYGLVGNNQGRDPWLDESFATYAQGVVDGERRSYELDEVPDRVAGLTGQPMEFFEENGRFYSTAVYVQGAAALLEARERVGPEQFDAAVRGYIAANAYEIATPADVETAFGDMPDALEVLREVGALP